MPGKGLKKELLHLKMIMTVTKSGYEKREAAGDVRLRPSRMAVEY